MSKVFIIAEAGVNHNGDIELAKRLIDAAVDAKVDAVKFQTFNADYIVSKNARKAEYQLKTTNNHESQYEMLKKLELDFEAHKTLIEYCTKKNIMFLSTAFDLESIDLLCKLGLEVFKIPSGEMTNLPYLEKVGKLKKKVILSTGMCALEEVKKTLDVIKSVGTTDITILHCNTEYPTPMEDVNLRAMAAMGAELQVPIGYSDHTNGIEVSIAAVALGASVIEKHLTLDKNMEGPDHKASLEPNELKEMVNAIRNIEAALGKSKKVPTSSEEKNRQIARKSIVAKKHINKGELLTEENITTKRPGSGISPMRWREILGTIANKEYEEDELIVL
ncbi:MAG: N-acetylneuraminate synthase family protein putative legionaminic acid synthase LegI [Anaerocolumna sp.]|nr:N-acetylneuraminate synthase family protein putative legionaminic acid synthase LegI [Anaerocolumna sp.]